MYFNTEVGNFKGFPFSSLTKECLPNSKPMIYNYNMSLNTIQASVYESFPFFTLQFLELLNNPSIILPCFPPISFSDFIITPSFEYHGKYHG